MALAMGVCQRRTLPNGLILENQLAFLYPKEYTKDIPRDRKPKPSDQGVSGSQGPQVLAELPFLSYKRTPV